METHKRLDENTRAFFANGKKYLVYDDLTVADFQRLEELRVEMEAGNTAGDLIKLIGKAYELLNTQRFADASVAMYNALNISERIATKKPPAFLVALTLFVRPEGSAIPDWNETDAEQWIEDWNAEGYGITELFDLAFATRMRLNSGFLRSSHDTSSAQNSASGSAGK